MRRALTAFLAIVGVLLALPSAAQTASRQPRAAISHDVRALKITTLSTMLADKGLGEWGYAALVEVDGHRILFDTGADPELVLRNAKVLGIDLSTVTDVVISHFHDDHNGGLLPIRLQFAGSNPGALARLHVGKGIMDLRYDPSGKQQNDFPQIAAAYAASGGTVAEHDGPFEIYPGVWLTGPVPRHNDESNWSGSLQREGAEGRVEDNVIEDSSLVIRTKDGLVILTGCGHAGIMNIADFGQLIGQGKPILAVIGGLHLFAKSEAVLAATAVRLKGIRYLLAAHCTGIEATLRLRELLGLDRRTAVVAATGSSFALGKGIDALEIAGPGPGS